VFADLFEKQVGRGKIPWFLGGVGLLPIVGAAMDVIQLGLDAASTFSGNGIVTSADRLAGLMADGGSFVKVHALEKDAYFGELLAQWVFYNVMVGTENRYHVIYLSRFALRVEKH
jgi:hypothetical protein